MSNGGDGTKYSCLETGYFGGLPIGSVGIIEGDGHRPPPPEPGLSSDERARFGRLHREEVERMRSAPKLPASPFSHTWGPRLAERMANSKIICREVFGVEWGKAGRREKEWCSRLHKQIEDRAYRGINERFTYPCEYIPRSEDDGAGLMEQAERPAERSA